MSVAPHSETSGRIPMSVLLRYGIGQLGAQIFRDAPAVLLPLFLITLVGVPAWLAGLVVLLPKVWLIFCDPMIGNWYDKAKVRIGRTPFLVSGAIGTSLGLIAPFVVVTYPNYWLAAASVCLIFFAGSTAFSVFSVPYLAAASELSNDPLERNRIIVLRMIFGTIGVLIGVGMPQLLVAHFGGGAVGWHKAIGIFAGICLVSMMTTALGLRGTPSIQAAPSPGRLAEQMRVVCSNRAFMVLLLSSFLSNIGQATSYTVVGFVFLYKVKSVSLIPLYILVMSCSSLLAKPMWLWLPGKIGKKMCFVGASIVWIAVTMTWLLLGKFSEQVINLPVFGAVLLEHALILFRAIIIGVANGGFVLIALSMMTDTVDHNRRTAGIANEGVFSGVFSAFEKFAFAVGPLIAGAILSLFGFVSSHGQPVVQNSQAIFGVVLLYSVVPATLQLLALLVLRRYQIRG